MTDRFAVTNLRQLTHEAPELQNASPLASFGHELELIKIHRTQAQDGCGFLIMPAPDDEQAERVAAVARATKAIMFGVLESLALPY